MNLKRLFLLLLCLCSISMGQAQQWKDIQSHPEFYLYGEGWGATVDEADQQALAALVSQISVAVSNDFCITEDERSQNGTLDAKTYTRNKLQTYSSATLTNTERLVIDNNPDHTHLPIHQAQRARTHI